jgi:uncharacterized UPF0146 family protein
MLVLLCLVTSVVAIGAPSTVNANVSPVASSHAGRFSAFAGLGLGAVDPGPSNDFFISREPLLGSSGSVGASNVLSSLEPSEPIPGGFAAGHSIWFSIAMPSHGRVELSTCGSDFDTLIAVYEGTTIGDLSELTSNDDACGLQSFVTFVAMPDVLYSIQLLGVSGATGAVTLNWSVADQPPQHYNMWRVASTFDTTRFLATRPNGNVIVSTTDPPLVQEFLPNGTPVQAWGTYGTGKGQFGGSAGGIAVASDGSVLVVDPVNHRVQRFDSTGNVLITWGTYGTLQGQFRDPWGVAVSSTDTVYIADSYNRRVQEFTLMGEFVRSWGSYGTAPGQFGYPFGIAVSPGGDVFVTDAQHNRLSRFTATGDFISMFGSSGRVGGQFKDPAGVAVAPNGNIYVADSNNHRIQAFTGAGAFLTSWGSSGNAAGQLNQPWGVAVGLNNEVLVADSNNYRIQRFGYDSTPPIASVTVPVSDQTVPQGSSVDASFSCVDEAGGSGLDTCVGTVPDGDPIDTSTLGVMTFTVAATDVAGNETTVTHTYTVVDVTDPTVTITTPAADGVYGRGRTVLADYACSDVAGGSGLDTCVGTVPDGDPIDTSTLGAHTFSVTATDNAGNDSTVTHTYTVIDVTDPTATIMSPAADAVIERDANVLADFTCADEVGGSGIDTCVGTVPDGDPIDTSTLGAHTFSVTATDVAGNDSTVTHTYTVIDVTDPTIQIASPADGAVFARGRTVQARYACADETEGSGIRSCVGRVATGTSINTSSPGTKTFTVTATDNAGNTTRVTRTYTVALARPDARIQRGTGRLVGNNIYNTTTGQTVTGSARRGQAVTYFASLQNDTPFTDALRVRANGSTTRFTIRYLSPTGQNITSRVAAGTFTTPRLAPGDTYRIRIEVTIAPTAPTGASLTRAITATSATHPSRTDTVAFTTSRR